MLAIGEEEKKLTTGQVARLCDVNRDTVWDWIEHGVQTPLGTVRLEARKIGGRFKIKPADLAAFEARCNGEEPTPPDPADTPSHRAAMARLRRIGIVDADGNERD